jgi:hypothetical protein
MNKATTIGIVACSKQKRDDKKRLPARQRYCSPMFRMSLEYAERECAAVYIVSAMYGLITPDAEISDYDRRLSDLGGKRHQKAWGVRIASTLIATHGKRNVDYLLMMGEDYAAPLRGGLHVHGGYVGDTWQGVPFDRMHEPLKGLALGPRLSKLRSLLVALALALACVACNSIDPGRPHVHLIADTRMPVYLDGARAWTPLGFAFDFTSDGRVECQRRWFEGSDDCQLTIGIVVDPLTLERTGSPAAADRHGRVVYLDDTLGDSGRTAMRVAIAHEIGHIVLDTPEHTKGGIMGAASWQMTEVDYALACESIGRGCR